MACEYPQVVDLNSCVTAEVFLNGCAFIWVQLGYNGRPLIID